MGETLYDDGYHVVVFPLHFINYLAVNDKMQLPFAREIFQPSLY